jgi:hypothetical protein
MALQAAEGNDADAAVIGPSSADESLLGAATGPAAAATAAAAGGLAVALGGREQPPAVVSSSAPAPAAPAAAAPVPAAVAQAPVFDLLGGDDYMPNGKHWAVWHGMFVTGLGMGCCTAAV